MDYIYLPLIRFFTTFILQNRLSASCDFLRKMRATRIIAAYKKWRQRLSFAFCIYY